MSNLDIRVTKIGHRWHARLLKGDIVLDEMACEYQQDIGWMCREMMRWADKGFDQDQFTAASRERHNEDGRPVGKIWYQNKLRKQI